MNEEVILPEHCTVDNIPELLSGNYKPGVTLLRFDDIFTSTIVLKPPHSIRFINKDWITCIEIIKTQNEIKLDNYYYRCDIKECPILPHNIFFKFLYELGEFYKQPVVLEDASVKIFANTSCVIPGVIFSLAGHLTFYEKLGFASSEYTAFIEKIRQMTLGELLFTAKQVPSLNPEYDPDILDPSKIVLTELEGIEMSLNTLVGNISFFLVNECKIAHVHNSHPQAEVLKPTKRELTILTWFRNVLQKFSFPKKFLMERFTPLDAPRKGGRLVNRRRSSIKKRATRRRYTNKHPV
jgi:hypothetical protein